MYDSILILSVVLIGIVGFLYGIRAGLLSILPMILLNTAILYLVSGEPYDILLSYNPTGIILSMLITIVTGAMRESCDTLNSLRDTLASRIDDATYELDKLTAQLIDNDEMERIRIGQDLHDGIGQYLTGMLLYSEALTEQLIDLKTPEARMASTIKTMIQDDILLIRNFARSFLPNYQDQSGFEAAMGEMIDYFSETTSVKFKLELSDNLLRLPGSKALHLYRVAQDAIFCLLNNSKSTVIEISMLINMQQCILTVDGKQTSSYQISQDVFTSKTLKYRSRTIHGDLTLKDLDSGDIRLRCTTSLEENTG